MRTPLFLAILCFAYDDKNFVHALQSSTSNEDRLKYLFDEYWIKAIKRPLVNQKLLSQGIKSQAYGERRCQAAKQTRKWIVYLAKHLEQESQPEFLIEKIQPSWLLMGEEKRWYQLIIGLIIGIIFGSIFGSIFGGRFGLMIGLMSGLIFGSLSGSEKEVKLVERCDWSFKKVKDDLNLWQFFIGLIMVPTGFIFGLMSGLNVSELNIKRRPNQGIWRSLVNALSISLITGSITWLISMLIFEQTLKPHNALFLGLVFGLHYGGFASIQHLALRLVLFRSGRIPWNYARFLKYCTERLFLQQVVGRYRFMHKLLQKHFAAMPLEQAGSIKDCAFVKLIRN